MTAKQLKYLQAQTDTLYKDIQFAMLDTFETIYKPIGYPRMVNFEDLNIPNETEQQQGISGSTVEKSNQNESNDKDDENDEAEDGYLFFNWAIFVMSLST
ncbi:hypothetical protein RFF05_12550 [Bengtsoniella intestinalis]|uniref:hypothetical protein n=1 Tax=Bengtsoniella intestinalis TaxID=3073143 RepID=UPI00391F3DAE